MLGVHTNYASIVAQGAVNKSNNLLTNAMERLSTGLRINSASDDAAGLQIANRMSANVKGMETASRNISDATSMLQTADGALEELTTIANRQKELATQASNGVNSTADLKALDDEFKQLNAEITRIVENTTYAGNNLFKDATDGVLVKGVTFQIGSDGAEQMSVTLGAIDKTVTGDLLTSAAANTAIGAVDTFLAKVGTERSTLGANINRLGHTAANLASVTENTKAAAGRIMDADFAVESANMTRNQLLVQAGTTVLSSANQNTGLVMGLLR
ncbi:Lateral flagellin [Shewanella sp. NKUCC05_KAH]|uniref:Flagellin n=1 Tax=Shewanella oncorhynchi TaxID=2726434 RepID=A0ABX1KP24_9GAMM|nr:MULTISPECIES: flagellin [Shewanella]RBP77662.1 flagellin [Shewanella putrefaciens]GCF91415.1 lateral flagellin [Shewanella sp. M-Br]MBI1675396.1 Lateral flagellin [Shewanella sp. DW31]MBW3517054.1 Lateral flagellin [Shewanella sp. NKUCC01_JLK]MBW3528424.1 Lateral flagellin [Shewanella sp. NKUCC05_KAH]